MVGRDPTVGQTKTTPGSESRTQSWGNPNDPATPKLGVMTHQLGKTNNDPNKKPEGLHDLIAGNHNP